MCRQRVIDAASAPLGLTVGSISAFITQVSSEDEEDYMAEDLFLVRDHLGSVVMTLKAQKTCTMWMEPPGPGEGDPECGAWAYVLNPIETFEYDPYGQPTAHVPASEDTPSGAGYLALKTAGAFAMPGEKSGYTLLDRNDIGRSNGTPGNTWVRNGAVPAAQSHYGWNYLFTARPWDSDVRQYYVRHRWYDPLQGRWTAVDPIGYRGGLNQYAYCGGNPVCFIDLTGLKYDLCEWDSDPELKERLQLVLDLLYEHPEIMERHFPQDLTNAFRYYYDSEELIQIEKLPALTLGVLSLFNGLEAPGGASFPGTDPGINPGRIEGDANWDRVADLLMHELGHRFGFHHDEYDRPCEGKLDPFIDELRELPPADWEALKRYLVERRRAREESQREWIDHINSMRKGADLPPYLPEIRNEPDPYWKKTIYEGDLISGPGVLA